MELLAIGAGLGRWPRTSLVVLCNSHFVPFIDVPWFPLPTVAFLWGLVGRLLPLQFSQWPLLPFPKLPAPPQLVVTVLSGCSHSRCPSVSGFCLLVVQRPHVQGQSCSWLSVGGGVLGDFLV